MILGSNIWQKIQLLCYLPFTVMCFLNTAYERESFQREEKKKYSKINSFYQFVLSARIS